MIDILKFVFSSFWVWAGSAFMLLIISQTVSSVLVAMLQAIRGRLN